MKASTASWVYFLQIQRSSALSLRMLSMPRWRLRGYTTVTMWYMNVLPATRLIPTLRYCQYLKTMYSFRMSHAPVTVPGILNRSRVRVSKCFKARTWHKILPVNSSTPFARKNIVDYFVPNLTCDLRYSMLYQFHTIKADHFVLLICNSTVMNLLDKFHTCLCPHYGIFADTHMRY